MYSGTLQSPKYRVYKKSITEYRVEAQFGNGWVSCVNGNPENLMLTGCELHVCEEGRKSLLNSKADGIDAPVFAWIVCEGWEVIPAHRPHNKDRVFFNPYRVDKFVDRATENPVNSCDEIIVHGNILSYS
tara:strand:+ start:3921 stop:4310 length:390 start_codon:yes stop_codon:yes gene_type:complete